MEDSVRLVIGNSLNGDEPSKAMIKEFRIGDRNMASYEYDTLPLDELDPTFPKSRHVEVSEVKRFFERDSEPRMTTGMFAFFPLTQDEVGKYYTRSAVDNSIDSVDSSLLRHRLNAEYDEEIGLKFIIRQNGGVSQRAYFDNGIFDVSGVLWEFSPTEGDGKWYQMFELPNQAYHRITLPEPTTKIRARAISNDPSEWVQSFAIAPVENRQLPDAVPGLATAEPPELTIDDYGYARWTAVDGGKGAKVYVLAKNSDKSVVGRYTGLHAQLADDLEGVALVVRCEDESDSSTDWSNVATWR